MHRARKQSVKPFETANVDLNSISMFLKGVVARRLLARRVLLQHTQRIAFNVNPYSLGQGLHTSRIRAFQESL